MKSDFFFFSAYLSQYEGGEIAAHSSDGRRRAERRTLVGGCGGLGLIDAHERHDAHKIDGPLRRRQRHTPGAVALVMGDAVRLEVAENCSPEMTRFLLEQFGLDERELYRVEGPVNLVRLMQVPDSVDRPDLKFPLYLVVCHRP